MITETKVKKFQKNNKKSDVMGVVRTLSTNIQFSVSNKDKSNEVQN
jgi:hypothetical protein